jgi:hypothetical protein
VAANNPDDLVLVSGLTKLGNTEGESWVTLREAEAAAVCAELSKLHAEHLQDVERMDRAATAMEAYQAEIAGLRNLLRCAYEDVPGWVGDAAVTLGRVRHG